MLSRIRTQVKIYRWRDILSRHGNFGDEITITILERLFGIEAVPAPPQDAEFIGAGSILDVYGRRTWKRKILNRLTGSWRGAADLHVWGSGFMLLDSVLQWPQRLHIHAVRGPMTARRLGPEAATIGDPGILASRLIEKRCAKFASVALVPHHSDYAWAKAVLELPPGWKIVCPRRPVPEVIDQIASAEIVVSSSLHGLITADSFGIPCMWAQTHHPLYANSTYKFHDYAASRGADFNRPISYREIMAFPKKTIEETVTVARRDLAAWQDALLKAFPF
jgi:pyruvyltransferase